MYALQCDGLYPCNRCQDDNVICLFGERDKAQDKTWPRGTVELCLKKQRFYEQAIIELYEVVLDQKAWKGGQVRHSADGRPLIHDILAGLGTCNITRDYEETSDRIETIMSEESSPSSSPRRIGRRAELDLEIKSEPADSHVHPLAELSQRASDPSARRTSARRTRPRSSTTSQEPPQQLPGQKNEDQYSIKAAEIIERMNRPLSRAKAQAHPPRPSYPSAVSQRQTGNNTPAWPAQVPLATPNLSPDTESPTVMSPFGSYSFATAPSQTWQMPVDTQSFDVGTAYQTDALLGDPMIYEGSFDGRGNYAWQPENYKQQTEDTILWSAMTERPPQDSYGLGDYPLQ
ncbi:MAG: hypothetical protein Q9191_004366 [Dirinaria sp. TL-2023a]